MSLAGARLPALGRPPCLRSSIPVSVSRGLDCRTIGIEARVWIEFGRRINTAFRRNKFNARSAAPVGLRELTTSDTHPQNLVAGDEDVRAVPLACKNSVAVWQDSVVRTDRLTVAIIGIAPATLEAFTALISVTAVLIEFLVDIVEGVLLSALPRGSRPSSSGKGTEPIRECNGHRHNVRRQTWQPPLFTV